MRESLRPGVSDFPAEIKDRDKTSAPEEEERRRFGFSDDRRLSQEFRLAATEQAVDVFARILFGLEHYAVISSMARFLQKKTSGIENEKAPGDIDIAVFSNEKESSGRTFNLIRQRLTRIGAVFQELDSDKVIEGNPNRSFPDGTPVIRGYLPMLVDGKEVGYKFEVFYDSRVAPRELERKCDNYHELRFLNREATKTQYALNAELEGRVREGVRQALISLRNLRESLGYTAISKKKTTKGSGADSESTKERLDQPLAKLRRRHEGAKYPEEFKKIAEDFDLTAEELEDVYELIDQMDAGEALESKRVAYNKIVKILTGGLKEKLYKRLDQLEALREETRIEVGSVAEEERAEDEPLTVEREAA